MNEESGEKTDDATFSPSTPTSFPTTPALTTVEHTDANTKAPSISSPESRSYSYTPSLEAIQSFPTPFDLRREPVHVKETPSRFSCRTIQTAAGTFMNNDTAVPIFNKPTFNFESIRCQLNEAIQHQFGDIGARGQDPIEESIVHERLFIRIIEEIQDFFGLLTWELEEDHREEDKNKRMWRCNPTTAHRISQWWHFGDELFVKKFLTKPVKSVKIREEVDFAEDYDDWWEIESDGSTDSDDDIDYVVNGNGGENGEFSDGLEHQRICSVGRSLPLSLLPFGRTRRDLDCVKMCSNYVYIEGNGNPQGKGKAEENLQAQDDDEGVKENGEMSNKADDSRLTLTFAGTPSNECPFPSQEKNDTAEGSNWFKWINGAISSTYNLLKITESSNSNSNSNSNFIKIPKLEMKYLTEREREILYDLYETLESRHSENITMERKQEVIDLFILLLYSARSNLFQELIYKRPNPLRDEISKIVETFTSETSVLERGNAGQRLAELNLNRCMKSRRISGSLGKITY